jgi:hypothetical protein
MLYDIMSVGLTGVSSFHANAYRLLTIWRQQFLAIVRAVGAACDPTRCYSPGHALKPIFTLLRGEALTSLQFLSVTKARRKEVHE